MATAFLAAGMASAAQPAPPEKDMLIGSYEGVAPELTRYALDGRFDARRVFDGCKSEWRNLPLAPAPER